MNSIIAKINKKYMKKQIPDVVTGDVVRVSKKIEEGDKSRTQVFEGMVISREGGNGINASITVRKIASGVGVEKKFTLHSPVIEKVEVLRSSKVRRKKIFYIRGLSGKAAKLRGKNRKILEYIGEEIKEEEPELEETVSEESQGEVENQEEVKNEETSDENKEEVLEEKTEDSPAEETKEEPQEDKEEKAEEPKVETKEEEKPAEEVKEEPKEEAQEEVKEDEKAEEKVEETKEE